MITLVVHTPERAEQLRRILAEHSVKSECVPVSVPDIDVPDCVEVRISPASLPVALKILESGGAYSSVKAELEISGSSGSVLIPVDLTDYSMMACEVGLQLARRLQLHPVVLHTYSSPVVPDESVVDSEDALFDDAASVEMETALADSAVRNECARRFKAFVADIRRRQLAGEYPDIEFSSSLRPGLPEDVIADYCRTSPPALVVMATRGHHKKESELVGSVTAEVLDSCRVPVFAVPEDYVFQPVEDIRNLVFFCNIDRQDLYSFDSLMRMFGYPEINVTLIPVSDRQPSRVAEKMAALENFLSRNYPTATFARKIFPRESFRGDFENFVRQNNVQLLIVPNKKTNVFRRLFRPGIAHKMLFERDMPMLALPV